MNFIQSMAYLLAALAFLLFISWAWRWWRRRTAYRRLMNDSGLLSFSRGPRIKWPVRREASGRTRGAQSSFPVCPSCRTPSRPSPLEGRFECPRCGRLFS